MSTPQSQAEAVSSDTGEAASLLEVKNLVKDFPGMRALDHVNLTVKRGEIHALLGENGAGKSTLIKCVVGAHPPSAGEILLNGKKTNFQRPQDAQAAGISVVHQHANLVPNLTVQENLLLGYGLPRRGGVFVDWRATTAHARELFERVHLDIDPKCNVSDLRPDEVAMVAIAKAVASNAKLIILDEPTAALSPNEASVLFEHMRRLAREGHGFLYVSHRLAEVFEIADRLTVLRDGKLVGVWDRNNTNRRKIVNAIVGSDREPGAAVAAVGKLGDVILKIRNLGGGRVRSASFDVRAGEILGIAGLPGSGAEEIMDLLYGRAEIAHGEIEVDGKPILPDQPRKAIRAGLALVPKDRHAEANLPGFTVRENITVAVLNKFLTDPIFRFMRRGAERCYARDVVKRLNVKTPGVEAKIDELSGGNQQKTILGRWFSTDAKVFLLNSPTAAVDVGAKTEIYDIMRELAGRGAALLFTSTEIEEFPRLCPRVIVFHEGEIAGELTGQQVTEANIMALAIGERDDI